MPIYWWLASTTLQSHSDIGNIIYSFGEILFRPIGLLVPNYFEII
jgi:hypothetical protein